MSLAARAKALLMANPATQALRPFVTCRDGALTLSGAVADERERGAVEEMLAAIPGVTSVRNELLVLRSAGMPMMRI